MVMLKPIQLRVVNYCARLPTRVDSSRLMLNTKDVGLRDLVKEKSRERNSYLVRNIAIKKVWMLLVIVYNNNGY